MAIPEPKGLEPESDVRHSDGELAQSPFAGIKKSDLRRTAPKPGSKEAQNVDSRNKMINTFLNGDKLPGEGESPSNTNAAPDNDTENIEVLTFEDAKEAYTDIADGDHSELEKLNEMFCNKKTRFIQRQPKAQDGGPGWHCIEHPRTKLTPEQSQELAALINSKIDPVKMKEEAEARKAEKDAKKAKKETAQKAEKPKEAPKKKSAPEITDKDILDAIPRAINRKELDNVSTYCEKMGLDSEEIKEAISSQYDAIDEKRRKKSEKAQEKVFEGHVKWAIGKMEGAKSTPHLKDIIERELGHMVVIKKGRGRYDWTVELKKGKPEAYKRVAEEAMGIKEEVGEKARKKAELENAREGIESLLRRVRR